MKQFNGYDEAKKSASYKGGQIPVGGYVCKIMAVKYLPGENGNSDMIAVQFDVTEGEQKGFFRKLYDNNTSEDKKWKGKATIYVPKDDGTEEDGWTKNTFAKWTNGFEQSNSGYEWDWDESKWKGLIIGIVFGQTGTVIEGKEVVYSDPRYPVPAEDIRDNSYKIPAFKKKNGYTGRGGSGTGSSDDFVEPKGSSEEIPFL